MRNFGLWCFMMVVYGAVLFGTHNFFIAMGAMLLSYYLIRSFIKPNYANNNSNNGNWSDGDFADSISNSNDIAVYNPTTGLRMCGDFAGGVDVGGHIWCE
jgi:hypothetical protein